MSIYFSSSCQLLVCRNTVFFRAYTFTFILGVLTLLSNILLHPTVSLIPNFLLISTNFLISILLILVYFTQLNTHALMIIFSITLLISNLISICIFILSIIETYFLIIKNKKIEKEIEENYIPQINDSQYDEEEIEMKREKKKKLRVNTVIESPMFEIQLSPINKN
eukprot:gene1019-9924_t